MEKLINIHTHSSQMGEGICITNLPHTDTANNDKDGLFSVGLHPMHAVEFNPTLLADLEEKVNSNKKIVAIGEIGIDKLCHVNLSAQALAFSEQLKLSEKYNLPCIIHNVRGTDMIIDIVKKLKIQQPLIFHGFRGKPEVAMQIISAAGYLSFGKAITITDHATIASFLKTPIDKLFLETDDAEITIEEVYEAAATLKRIPLEELVSEISANFARLFKARQ